MSLWGAGLSPAASWTWAFLNAQGPEALSKMVQGYCCWIKVEGQILSLSGNYPHPFLLPPSSRNLSQGLEI